MAYPDHRRPHFSSTIEEARKHIRQIRRGLRKSFHKTPSYKLEDIIVTSVPGAPSPLSQSYSIYRSSRKESEGAPDKPLPCPPLSSSSSGSSSQGAGRAMDGAVEKRLGHGKTSAPIAAIFVHAGAGYHSSTNEHIHLSACNDAAKLAMKILKNGGTAVDAVEAAIKVLEDKEITNAGYGSNLTIDGVVECDATVVDHLGRSGACGAVAKIKNPINLARMILDQSSRPLSLRRVPPNLLVGEGASDFAWEYGMNVVPHDAVISKNARDRFLRWREDLRRAGGTRITPETPSSRCSEDYLDLEYEERVRNKQRRDHTNAILNGTWNEGQPDSPQPQSPAPKNLSEESFPIHGVGLDMSPSPEKTTVNLVSPVRPGSRSPSNSGSPAKRPRFGKSRTTSDGTSRTHSLLGPSGSNFEAKSSPDVALAFGGLQTFVPKQQREGNDGPTSPLLDDKRGSFPSIASVVPADAIPTRHFAAEAFNERSNDLAPIGRTRDIDEDMITDTVGAIAIDLFGNIAAAASSGGIGMKHRGRVGPAALVGIGTAVIPVDAHDPEGITVAAVTSGTGEHMATTMASQKCAERLYFSTRRGYGGINIEATDEEAMDSFVKYDFMDHPGVKHSHSAGAIGVMAVKKTPYGYFLHFAHNTESFALASMHSNEKDSKCVMSRIGDRGGIVQGGRKIRVD